MSPAFVKGRAGFSFDSNPATTGWWGDTVLLWWLHRAQVPSPEEQGLALLALGYPRGATAAPGLTATERHVVTRNCMDQRCVPLAPGLSLPGHCFLSPTSRCTNPSRHLRFMQPLQFSLQLGTASGWAHPTPLLPLSSKSTKMAVWLCGRVSHLVW